MNPLPASLQHHRAQAEAVDDVVRGEVHYAPLKSLWFFGMAGAALVGGALTFSWAAFGVFLVSTGTVLLLGHSLGSHRKLIHDSFQCPKWLEYTLVYCGVQVGLAGPIGLLRQHELRDYAQRLPDCHDYLRHGSSFWRDAWWQLCCDLRLHRPPSLTIEPRIANDRFYRFLERSWMLQQLPPALLLYAAGGWGFVFWGVCARVTAGVLGHWLIGYFAHNRGGMHYVVDQAAVQGRNIRFTALLTMGECWHNNHHAFPGSARLGLSPGEWDPGWWALMVLRRLGWVWGIRLPNALPERPELHALDAAGVSQLKRKPSSPEFASAAAQPTLRKLLRLCLDKPSQRYVMEGPAANLSAGILRRLAGPNVDFQARPEATRLTLRIGDQLIRGLPALCLSLSLGRRICRALSLTTLPLAVGVEALRSSFDLA